MTKNKFGELVYSESDLIDFLMSTGKMPDGIIANDVTVNKDIVVDVPTFLKESDSKLSVEKFDRLQQNNWYMPDEYKKLDIAEYILNLCTTDEQLQRVGHELLLYQNKNLFNLLRYLKYLVDTMKQHNIIWGVGRGSSVASYVLYLLEVHRVDSIYYDLDPKEFLR